MFRKELSLKKMTCSSWKTVINKEKKVCLAISDYNNNNNNHNQNNKHCFCRTQNHKSIKKNLWVEREREREKEIKRNPPHPKC